MCNLQDLLPQALMRLLQTKVVFQVLLFIARTPRLLNYLLTFSFPSELSLSFVTLYLREKFGR